MARLDVIPRSLADAESPPIPLCHASNPFCWRPPPAQAGLSRADLRTGQLDSFDWCPEAPIRDDVSVASCNGMSLAVLGRNDRAWTGATPGGPKGAAGSDFRTAVACGHSDPTAGRTIDETGLHRIVRAYLPVSTPRNDAVLLPLQRVVSRSFPSCSAVSSHYPDRTIRNVGRLDPAIWALAAAVSEASAARDDGPAGSRRPHWVPTSHERRQGPSVFTAHRECLRTLVSPGRVDGSRAKCRKTTDRSASC